MPAFAALAISFLIPSAGTAQVVIADVVADFVPGVDPGDIVMPPATGTGSWRYLASQTLNPTDAGANLADLEWDTTAELFERPTENHTDGFSEDAIALREDALLMHPADLSDVVVARWITGPGEAGEIDIVGNVAKGDPGGGDGIRFLVFVDGVSLFDEVVAFDDVVGVPLSLTSVPVVEGSTTDFVVSKNGSAFFDSTFMTASVLQVPEPSAGMMGAVAAFVLFAVRVRGGASA
jgi:hypothetical protein